MDPDLFDELKKVKFVFPKVNPEDKDHYLKFSDVYGKSLTEDELPRLSNKGIQHPFGCVRKRARFFMQCTICGRPRIVYSKLQLSEEQQTVLDNLNESGVVVSVFYWFCAYNYVKF